MTRSDDPRPDDARNASPARRNTVVALACVGAFAGMVGLAFASVPLYRLFCQATGYNGTTQVAKAGTAILTSDRPITVRFDANVADGLPWRFSPEQGEEKLTLGQVATAAFRVHNTSDKPVTATAVFNVTPESMGAYFSKIECFCFTEQTLAPGADADLTVTYYVDPAMLDDKNSAGVHTVTLSYTLFPAEPAAKSAALPVSQPVPPS